MIKLAILMVLIITLLSFFSISFITFFGYVQDGFITLVNAFAIPIDFFGRVLGTMFSYHYIKMVLCLFLAIMVTIILFKFLRGSEFDVLPDEEVEESYIYHNDGDISEHTNTYSRKRTLKFNKHGFPKISRGSAKLVYKDKRYIYKKPRVKKNKKK